jgi:hypothetical protein
MAVVEFTIKKTIRFLDSRMNGIYRCIGYQKNRKTESSSAFETLFLPSAGFLLLL